MRLEDVILAWQFPQNNPGNKSELIKGRRVQHCAVGGQFIFLHFKCKDAKAARLVKKWSVEKGVVHDESLHMILRPAHTSAPANANAFEVQGNEVVLVLVQSTPKVRIDHSVEMRL
ncbi:MAG: hypothetical protein RLZZ76_571 [Candidatus Parcubacteria bacterium]|jgi:hypothetical protein